MARRLLVGKATLEAPNQKTWVVGYDFSQIAHHAVALGAEMMARQGGGRLLVVHAYPHDLDRHLKILDPERDGPSIELDNAYARDAQRQLEEDIEDIPAYPGVSVETRLVAGRPAGAISRTAAEEQAAMILLGHRRHSDGEVLIGGVVDQVIRRALCAVMVVKTTDGDR